jgi:hypothetical protein
VVAKIVGWQSRRALYKFSFNDTQRPNRQASLNSGRWSHRYLGNNLGTTMAMPRRRRRLHARWRFYNMFMFAYDTIANSHSIWIDIMSRIMRQPRCCRLGEKSQNTTDHGCCCLRKKMIITTLCFLRPSITP